jgi:hypothetical protein
MPENGQEAVLAAMHFRKLFHFTLSGLFVKRLPF